MTKFILHGGFSKVENELNRTFFEEFVKNIPDNGKVLLVYFATREEENIPASFEIHIKKCKEHSGSKNLKFSMATKENFLEEVKQSDAIMINGGSTRKLLNVLGTYPSLLPLMEGKTVAGTSAGAYALATLGASHSEDQAREGLGLVPLRVICHFESTELPPQAGSVEFLKNTRQDLELVTLKDFEWKVFKY